jgi:hypothetical protein
VVGNLYIYDKIGSVLVDRLNKRKYTDSELFLEPDNQEEDLKKNAPKNYMQQQKEKYSNAYKARTKQEDEQLMKEFSKHLSHKEISVLHQRNLGAICSRI